VSPPPQPTSPTPIPATPPEGTWWRWGLAASSPASAASGGTRCAGRGRPRLVDDVARSSRQPASGAGVLPSTRPPSQLSARAASRLWLRRRMRHSPRHCTGTSQPSAAVALGAICLAIHSPLLLLTPSVSRGQQARARLAEFLLQLVKGLEGGQALIAASVGGRGGAGRSSPLHQLVLSLVRHSHGCCNAPAVQRHARMIVQHCLFASFLDAASDYAPIY
jgi:hypothetical protein